MASEYLDYTTRTGDRLDLLAYRFYGDALQWPRIMEANPAPALDELRQPVLNAGTLLKIPIVTQADLLDRQVFEPWR